MGQPDDMFADEDYPAYTMGRAAEIIGTTPDFLRRLDDVKLIDPHRSAGGHRRYSRYQLRLAARAREMVVQGTPLDAACRIIILEDQLEEALRHNEQHAHPCPHPTRAPRAARTCSLPTATRGPTPHGVGPRCTRLVGARPVTAVAARRAS